MAPRLKSHWNTQTIPFFIYMFGMYLFLAMLKANIEKAEKPVLAATAKIKAVDN